MSDTEGGGLCKLFQIAYLNAYKARPFVDFTDWVEWAELNGIKFNVTAYKNRTQCTKFVNFISKTLFEEDVKSKLKNANFIAVFAMEVLILLSLKKSAFIFCLLNHSNKSRLSFIALKDVPSQDADGIKSAIMKAFDDIGMPELKDRMVFLASNSANVNNEIKTGLATKLCKDGIDWLVFVWCLSHRLELALKDSLDDVLTSVKKKLNQLVLFVSQILKEI